MTQADGGNADSNRVELRLDSDLSNGSRARREIARLAERAGLDEEGVMAAKTVVTEAFGNAAAHAYPDGRTGPVEVLAEAARGSLTVSVRDSGRGITPSPITPDTRGRLGLLMIAALAEFCQLRRLPGGGTEVTARISRSAPADRRSELRSDLAAGRAAPRARAAAIA